jgi:hypothetical protein
LASQHWENHRRGANQADDVDPPEQYETRKIVLLALVILAAGVAGLFYFEKNSAVVLTCIIIGGFCWPKGS